MNNGVKKSQDVDAYIARFPEDVQIKLQEVRQYIANLVPEATEIISYQIPTFFLGGNLVHFAGYRHHIGLYPGSAPIAAFAEDLKPYKTGRGSVQFPLSEPMPLALIEKLVLYSKEQLQQKNKK